MVFSSVVFLFIFLPFTLIVHSFLSPKIRNFFLLLVSLLFYFWGENYLTLLILISILFNYFGGILIGKLQKDNPGTSKLALIIFIILNLGILVYFKYSHFIIENINLLGFINAVDNPIIHLPVGISFYTFHIMSYLIDVYRKDAIPQKKPFDLGLYIFLFPQLVAGPIIRYKDISQKIASRYVLGIDFTEGSIRFIRGLAKKVIIANTMAVVADNVFANPTGYMPAPVAWIGIICYTLQIYFDFSGYSDMAIGLGKMLGFNFPENFNYPYIAKSIQEFWQRWHISLSTWFRDYLYIPLGGSKLGHYKTYRNLFIVFFVTGLWHGASWNFIAWGLFHGTFLIIERIGFKQILKKLPAFLQHFYTLFVIILGWVFFRAWNFKYAIKYLISLLGLGHSNDYSPFIQIEYYSIFIFILAIIFSTKIRVIIENKIKELFATRTFFQNINIVVGYLFYMMVLIYCAIELAQNNYNPFIYYRF